MTEKTRKILYIISMIFLGIAVIGGGTAITGFFLKNATVQLVGVIILLISYATSAALDFVSRRRKQK